MNYVWVVVGDASKLPVYSTTNKYVLAGWLLNRKSYWNLRVFRLTENVYPSSMEVCKNCLALRPDKPAHDLYDKCE